MIGYLDLPSGLSGDMFLGCLVDAGWPIAELARVIDRLQLPAGSVKVSASDTMRGPVRAMLVDVATAETHHARRLNDIRAMIESSDLPEAVRRRAVGVFTRLAHAEASVHGTTPDQIHFHEVGALDAIADIVGVCAGVHALGIEQIYASALPAGPGWVNTEHGMLPLPAPATLQLLAAAGAPVCPGPFQQAQRTAVSLAADFHVRHSADPSRPVSLAPAGAAPAMTPKELVTPTAAALLAEMAIFEQPVMRLARIGIGAGQRQFTWPNVARLWLGEGPSAGPLVQIETNIDDMNPQFYGSINERLFAAGALDVWLTPIQMKKGRPAVLLSVLASASIEKTIADLLLRETTTLGVRVHPVHRHEAAREFSQVNTPFGAVRVKVKRLGQQVLAVAPEYDDCKRLADAAQVPVREVFAAAQAAAQAMAISPQG